MARRVASPSPTGRTPLLGDRSSNHFSTCSYEAIGSAALPTRPRAVGSSAAVPAGDDAVVQIAVDAAGEDSAVAPLADPLSASKSAAVNASAKAATDAEHALSVRDALRQYPKAIAWSMVFSLAIAMEGYDKALIGGFFAFGPFVDKFGQDGPSGRQVTPKWQASLNNGARVGEIAGLLFNGMIVENFGFRKTMLSALALISCLIFIPVFAQNIQTLLVADILMGIPWGIFQTLTPAYAVEVTPVALRGYMATYVNANWGIGQLISAGVLRAFLRREDEWAFRFPYALQWMWPVPLMIALWFAPESPWWLVRCGRSVEAKDALRRLASGKTEKELDDSVAMMQHTNEVEREMEATMSTGTTYWDCFRGVNCRRSEIVMIGWLVQAACGSTLMGYAAYFFQQAGMPTSMSFDFSMALYATAILGVFMSWLVMARFGRRTIYLGGLASISATMFCLGCTDFAQTKSASLVAGGLLLLFTLCYDVSIGTVAYIVVAEIPSRRLMSKTIVLGRIVYSFQGIVNGVITPYMLNPNAWNWKAKAGFLWAGTSFACLVWTFFRLPEAKGRTYAELDLLFEQKIPARNFSKALVDPFDIQGDLHHSPRDRGLGLRAEDR